VRRARRASVANLGGLARLDSAQLELVPIDHGFCLPESLDPPYLEWLHWPAVRACAPSCMHASSRGVLACGVVMRLLEAQHHALLMLPCCCEFVLPHLLDGPSVSQCFLDTSEMNMDAC
jgi:hypothetical protein